MPELQLARRPSGSDTASGGAMIMPKPMRKVSRSRRVIGRLRRHGVVERPVEPLQHPAVGELGQQPIDRLVQPQLALLDQDHRRHRRDRLGHRGDAEDRVAPHRVAPPIAFVPITSTCISPRRLTSVTRPGTSPRSTYPASDVVKYAASRALNPRHNVLRLSRQSVSERSAAEGMIVQISRPTLAPTTRNRA